MIPHTEPVTCPFLNEPCPQGLEKGQECLLRVTTDFNPLTNFRDFEVVQCAICRQEVRIPKSAAPPKAGLFEAWPLGGLP